MTKMKSTNKKALSVLTALTIGLGVIAPLQTLANPVEAHATSVYVSPQMKEAILKVSVAEKLVFPEYTDSVLKQVNALPSGAVKSDLLPRIQKVKDRELFASVTNRLNAVERYELKDDLPYARGLVNQVTDKNLKADLTKRLDAVQTKESIQSVLNRLGLTDKFLSEEDLALVQAEIAKITDARAKADMNNQYSKTADKVYFANVHSLLKSAEFTYDLEFVSKAKSYASKLKDTRMKADASKQIAVVEAKLKERVYAFTPEDKAYRAIKSFDQFLTVHNLEYAKAKMKLVKDPKAKAYLEQLLAKAEDEFTARQLDQRLNYVNRTKEAVDLTKAKGLFNKLTVERKRSFQDHLVRAEDDLAMRDFMNRGGNVKMEAYDMGKLKADVAVLKNSSMKKDAEYRLAKFDTAYQAERATKFVQAVEQSKLASDFKVAKDVVSKLAPSAHKSSLEARLKGVEKQLRA